MDFDKILSFDLEITIDGKKLLHTGAVLGEQTLNEKKANRAISQLFLKRKSLL